MAILFALPAVGVGVLPGRIRRFGMPRTGLVRSVYAQQNRGDALPVSGGQPTALQCGQLERSSPRDGSHKHVMRIMFFGTYEARRHERVKVLSEGLAARGHEVFECNVPLRIGTVMRVRILRWPILVPLLVARVLLCWARLVPRALLSHDPDVVLVGYLGQFDVMLARLLWPRTTIVLDHWLPSAEVAQDRGLTGRWREGPLNGIDHIAMSAASIVLVDTEEHRGLLPPRFRGAAVVVPIGAPYAYFQEPRRIDEAPMRVVFFGTYTPLHGTPFIAQAIGLLDDRADIRVTMIGQGRDYARSRRIIGEDERVNWIDWLEPRGLARELAQHHICLGIFGVTEKAARVVPTKIYQGAAAGCAIVTGSNPAQERALGSVGFMVPRGDPAALADTLSMLAKRPDLVAAARRETARVAEGFSPFETVFPLHRRLLDLPSPTGQLLHKPSSRQQPGT